MSLDFSEVYRANGPAPVFSPDGRYLATAVDFRLVVRDVDTLNVVHLHSCLDKINKVDWGRDSNFILCGLYKRAIVQAFSMENPEWTCKIDEGPAGIAHACWSPDSRQILTTADFNIRITVWSLVNKSCIYIKAPKFSNKGMSFSPDGRFMALAERRECKDLVSVFSTDQWTVAAHFAVDTADLDNLEWSPDGGTIAVWDHVLSYKLLIYAPDGRALAKYVAYENALGVKSVAWSPSGQLIAVGSYDQAARVLNHITWKPFAEYPHPSTIKGPPTVVVYREVEEQVEAEGEGGTAVRARYTVCHLPHSPPSQKPPTDKPNPRLGVGTVLWSADSRFLASVNDNMPTAVWVWDMSRMELVTMLQHQDPVRCVVWDPVHPRLGICTGGSRVYVWAPEGASCVHVPLPGFNAQGLKWNPSGTAFVLTNRDHFCCAFLGGM